MGVVEGNIVEGTIGAPVGPVGISVVTTNQNLNDSVNRFVGEKHFRDSAGNLFDVVANTAGKNFTITVIDLPGGVKPVAGDFTVVDDDELEDGDDVPMPNTSTLQAAMAEAYVAVAFDVGDDKDNVPFVANVQESGVFTTQLSQIISANWTSRKQNQSAFWVAYVLGAFQGIESEDNDPNTESIRPGTVTLGITGPNGGSLVYGEVNRDLAEQNRTSALAEIQDTVVHEVGHAVGNNGKHPVTGADAVDANGVPIPFGTKSKNGILVTHHTYSKYQPAYLDWIRSSKKPNS